MKESKKSDAAPSSPKRARWDWNVSGTKKGSSNKKECAHDVFSLVEQKDKKYLERHNPGMKGKPYPMKCSKCKSLL